MEQLNPCSVLVTGSNRGLGLELIRHLTGKTNPPKWIFATCRDPAGSGAQDLKNLAAKNLQVIIITLEMEQLNPCSVLVTGSNRGLGLELIRHLTGKANPPKWIFATCRDPAGSGAQDLKNLAAKNLQVIIITLDITEPSSVKAAAAKVTECLKGAGLNLLINNAGVINMSSLEEETPESMAETYRTNVIGAMMVVQAFLPLLRKAAQEIPLEGMSCSKAGIINISSQVGSITSIYEWQWSHIVAYRCSKCALNMLSKCQSLHLAKDEILCVALHPGWIQTDMTNSMGYTSIDNGAEFAGYSEHPWLSL